MQYEHVLSLHPLHCEARYNLVEAMFQAGQASSSRYQHQRHAVYVCVGVRTYVGVCTCMGVRIYIRTCTHTCKYKTPPLATTTSATRYVCMGVCMGVHMCVYVHTYTHAHIHVRINPPPLATTTIATRYVCGCASCKATLRP